MLSPLRKHLAKRIFMQKRKQKILTEYFRKTETGNRLLRLHGIPKSLLRRHRMPSVPPSGGISTTERALSWYGKARSATQKRLFHDTGKPVRQHERGSSASPERLVCGTGKANLLCVSALRKCLKNRVFAAGWSLARADGSIAGLPLHIYAYAAGIMYIYANTLMRA